MNLFLRLLLTLFAAAFLCRAFPPAPHHVIYGTVRDEQGHPLPAGSAEVLLETAAGILLRSTTLDGAEPGVNFALVIPMDAGITVDAYRPTALKPMVSFKLRVRIGQGVYLPMQMTGNFRTLGRPGARTRIDLTLGEDSDGDGLPDAWERILASQTGHGSDLSAVTPDGDLDGDGLSNLAEYLAGTYAFDPEDGLSLRLLRVDPAESVAEFLAISGRTYEVQSSLDFQTWTSIPFRVGQAVAGPRFRSSNTRVERIRIPVPPDGAEPSAFYRILAR
jgi:hypothetical protein